MLIMSSTFCASIALRSRLSLSGRGARGRSASRRTRMRFRKRQRVEAISAPWRRQGPDGRHARARERASSRRALAHVVDQNIGVHEGTVGCAKAPGALPGRTGASIQLSSKKRRAIAAFPGRRRDRRKGPCPLLGPGNKRVRRFRQRAFRSQKSICSMPSHLAFIA